MVITVKNVLSILLLLLASVSATSAAQETEVPPARVLIERFEETPTNPDDLDGLWNWYDQFSTVFDALRAEIDDADFDDTTTQGDRKLRDAIDSGRVLVRIIGQLVERDSELSYDERELLIDGRLTSTQVIGTYFVQVGDCEEALHVLVWVTEQPELETRGLLREATMTWHERATACLADEDAARERDAVVLIEEPNEERSRRAGPFIGAGASFAAIIAGGGFLLASMSDADEYNQLVSGACVSDEGCGVNQLDALERSTGRKSRIGWGLVAGGSVVAATSLVLGLRNSRRGREENRISILPARFSDGTTAYNGFSMTMRLGGSH